MKGYVAPHWINKERPPTDKYYEAIHVHQTSPEALEGEVDVCTGKYGDAFIFLPDSLIGKRVRWIIETIGEGE